MAAKKAKVAEERRTVVTPEQSLNLSGRRPRVSISLGMTLNLGDYQSARVDVGCESDLYDNETCAEAFERMLNEIRPVCKEQGDIARMAAVQTPDNRRKY